MKKILFIGTGGTISCGHTDSGLAPALCTEELLTLIPQIREVCNISAVQPFALDSTNMSPKEWITIVKIIKDNYDSFDGFVIAHGTDTMAYGAAALSCLIQGSPKPVIFTGSQLSPSVPNSDVKRNLRDAFLCAVHNGAHGVAVVFAGRVIDGRCASKLYTRELDAFRSINCDDIGTITKDGEVSFKAKAPDSRPVFFDRLDSRVAIIKLTPAAPLGIFDIEGARAVIIESYGAGGLPMIYESKLSELITKGICVIMGTQAIFGGSNLALYRVGRVVKERFGLIEIGAMTAEYAVMKAMWALAYSKDNKDFKRLFAENIKGDNYA